MRKSSLGRRSTSLSVGGVDTACVRKEKKSLLLQPGYSTLKKASSEECMYRRPPRGQSTSSAQDDLSLLASYPLNTPQTYQKKRLVLPTSSARTNRSHSSLGGDRLSSFGGARSTKKESRPINDKHFQDLSLGKVQEYFFRQPNFIQILDNCTSIRPMSIKKFIGMVNYLFKRIDKRLNLNKDNYIENTIKLSRMLCYGGKIDKSWLLVVNAPHAWCHVIALLSWLVDYVNLQEALENSSLLFPETFETQGEEDILEENVRLIQPYVAEMFRRTNGGSDREIDFAKEDKALIDTIAQASGVSEEEIRKLEKEKAALRAIIDDPNYNSEFNKMKEQETALLAEKKHLAEIHTFIENSKVYMEALNIEKHNLVQDNENLLVALKEKAIERDEAAIKSKKLRENLVALNEDQKQRLEIQQNINAFEQCIEDLSKSVYDLDLKTGKIMTKLEKPLVEYNNLIAIHTIREPRLKGCIMDGMQSVAKPAAKEAASRADQILSEIRKDYELKCNALLKKLTELEKQKQLYIKENAKLLEELPIEENKSITLENELTELEENIKKETNEGEVVIKLYDKKKVDLINEDTIDTTADQNKLDEQKTLYENQCKELKDTKILIEDYLKHYKEKVDEAITKLEAHIRNNYIKMQEAANKK